MAAGAEQISEQIGRLYQQAQREIALQVREAVASGALATARGRRLQLAAVIAYLDQIGARSDEQTARLVRQALAEGDEMAAQDVKRLGAQVVANGEAAFYSVNREAARELEDALTGRLRTARETVGRQVADVFRRQGLQASHRAILGVEGSPDRAARRLARELRDRGQTAFIDKAGKRWRLETYARMAVRTTTREAVVQGQVNRLITHGVSLVRISSHASSCDVCGPYENRLIDLTGTLTVWEGEPVAAGPLPPLHPNCRHTIMGVSTLAAEARRELQREATNA